MPDTKHTSHRGFTSSLGLLCLMFYLLGNFGASSDLLDGLTGHGDMSSCNCVDESCCCGAPCCAPAPVSCCDTTGPDCAAGHEPTLDRLVFKTACTCGLNNQRSTAIVFSCDLHVLTTCTGPAPVPPGPDSVYKPDMSHWHSLMLDPPDQVPKIFLLG